MADPAELFKSYEQNAKVVYELHLPLMIGLHGTACHHYRHTQSVEDDAYGIHSGNSNVVDLGVQKILVSTTQWRIITAYEGGYLDDMGYMYCNFDIRDGDIIALTRADSLSIKFQAISTESLGVTTSVLRRFKLTNHGAS